MPIVNINISSYYQAINNKPPGCNALLKSVLTWNEIDILERRLHNHIITLLYERINNLRGPSPLKYSDVEQDVKYLRHIICLLVEQRR